MPTSILTSMSIEEGPTFSRRDVLRWLFVGRLTLAAGIFAGVAVTWGQAGADQTFIATALFILSLVVTGTSYWWVFLLEREPKETFLYAQIAFDALLVTGIVHITGGGESFFAPIYILVITTGALLLPLKGGILLAVLASILYVGDAVLLHDAPSSGALVLQFVLFSVVALVTGWVGDRLRRAGMALGAVESELRKLKLDTSDILENIATGVLTVDGQGRLAYLNRAGEALLGIHRAQWEGAEVVEAVEAAAPGLGQLLRRSIRDQVPLARYKVIARRNGEKVTLGVSTTVVEREVDSQATASGGPSAASGGSGDAPANGSEAPGTTPSASSTESVTALFQDISDQEQLDILNWRNARLEAVAELSASLAHEIKNPLASIRSAAEQLSQPTLDDEDGGTLRRLVVRESERLSRLLSEFIEFSAVRMGTEEEVDLSTVARDAVALVRQHPDAEDGPEIRISGLDREILIPGNADLLHRAIFNLLLNAVQFSEEGGRVVVQVQECGPGHRARGTRIENAVRVSVRDSGPGVDPDDLARIFDPFYTRREGGSGLGLALVHRAVEVHKGAVFVDSPAAGGAEFVIYLPGGPVGVPATADAS